jgi:hypothetical protein
MDSGHSLATLQNAWKLPARKSFSKIRSANKSRSVNLPFITFLRELINYISHTLKKHHCPMILRRIAHLTLIRMAMERILRPKLRYGPRRPVGIRKANYYGKGGKQGGGRHRKSKIPPGCPGVGTPSHKGRCSNFLIEKIA